MLVLGKTHNFRRVLLVVVPAVALFLVTLQEFYDAGNLTPSKVTMLVPDKNATHLISKSKKILLRDGARFCDGSNSSHPCIFDIGLHTGQDILLYLTSETARVLAVDANGEHVRAASSLFAESIDENRLRLVHAVIGPSRDNAATFWVNTVNNHFSSMNQSLGCRNPMGIRMKTGVHTYCRPVLVRALTCRDLIAEHGSPYYLKCDIEGMDRECIRSLKGVPTALLPNYVSFAGVHNEDIDALRRLGYSRFKVVNQAVIDATAPLPSLRGNSGPWGEAAHDYWLAEKWHDAVALKKRLPLPTTVVAQGKEINAWYDLHAAV